ncbi:hypothetical protein JCM3766R1_005015 [Sporobolomyces carnicolor]
MSRYRDERPEGGYPSRQGFPPRDYYPPSRPQSYEPRPPQYPGQPAYPPRSADGGPRYAGPVGSRAYEDRGFSNYSSGVGSNYAAPSRHDDRRERSGRDDGPRGVVRDSGWGSGFRPRSPARPRSHHRGRDDDTNRISESSGPTRDNKAGSDLETRVASRSSYRELSPSRGGSGGSLRTDARPSSELTSASGKASYERSSIQASTRASSAARPEFAQTSPVIEPGELVPTPKNAPIDLPSATSRRREGNHSGRAGQSGDGARGESSWTKSQGTHSAHAGRDRRSGYRDEPRHARGSAPDSDSSYANADTLGNKFQYSRRGASPSRTSHASRQAYASAGNPSPPHLRETTTRSTSNRRSRSPDRRLRGDSASPSRRRLSSLHNDKQTRSFHPRAFPNSSTADTTTLSQRPSLPVGANYRAGPAVPSAPTGPRALRSTLPESSNAFIADHGPRVTVDVSKGPKPKAGFAPIKTTQVAGPPTPAQHPATSNPAKHSGVKRFFPADEEEEAEREDHRKAKETISEEDGERRARTREKQGPEAERAQLARIARDDAGARGQGRFDEDRMARNGWMVRDGGEVPPPRARPYHDQDEDRLPFPTRSRQFPLYSRDIPSGPSAGSRRFGNANATPVGPSSQARVPASYERPSFQSFGGPRNGTFHAPTSANAVVPGVVERRWGAPNAASTSVPVPSHPNATEPDTGSGHRPSRPETSPERFSVTAGPGAPPSGTRSDKETTEQRRDDDSRSAVLPRDSPVTTAPSAPTSAAPARTAIQALPTANALGAQPTEFYERIVQVGEGTYGKVYKARNVETGELVAMKRIRMEAEKDGFPVTAVREIKLLQNLRHPNVVDLSEMLVSKGHVYMVMEYMDHDLTGILHHPTISFSPAHLKSLMQQFLEGLSFIHRRGVLHRDLKGSNILLSRSGELKIADFGLARFFARGRNNDYTNRVITQWYKPPELLFGATVYGEEVDMWSAGCIFLELFARRPVFQGQDEIHQLEVIFKITGTPSRENWPGVQDLPWYELVKPKTGLPSQLRSAFSKWISPAGLDVAESLLSLDPRGRPTAADALRMDYFVAEDPKPEPPDFLSGLSGSWHEFESKRARRRAREDGKDGTA